MRAELCIESSDALMAPTSDVSGLTARHTEVAQSKKSFLNKNGVEAHWRLHECDMLNNLSEV